MFLANTPLSGPKGRPHSDAARSGKRPLSALGAKAKTRSRALAVPGAPASSVMKPFWWLALGCAVGTALLLVGGEPQKLAPAEAGTIMIASE